jgi:hypothetical protein
MREFFVPFTLFVTLHAAIVAVAIQIYAVGQ